MVVSRELLLIAVAGKLAERGVRPEMDQERGMVTAWYDSPTSDRDDNLHKQSIRSLVERRGGEDWKVHINSMGESGFTIEVRPAPGAQRETEPSGAVDLTNGGVQDLHELADYLEEMAKKIRQYA